MPLTIDLDESSFNAILLWIRFRPATFSSMWRSSPHPQQYYALFTINANPRRREA
jgi:hypothetical protein